ncbi:tryptophan--tRNA ligase [Granulicella sp. 5B5]|uniref:tryptophan--tRNA ligase n=1 Tax=Granulicella sp. 5B5 TaxID=1617967 RepID=UPI0015F380E1|nr:tryptophan--tRNA ligase [Granulicella sp. 5B5]QMV19007.1 tryptophan--tRNA ligase [Granulicella sp. 5B5]
MSPTHPRSVPRPRVLSGMRPTGRLHLGNYMGALHNWVNLQQDYDCYFFIADLHALTTDYADPSLLQQNLQDVALDFLAAGLDPGRCVIFKQSEVMHHAQLHLLFSMFTPLGWLERVPTYKDQQEQLREKDLATYGFLGYPLLQAADILLYKPDFVPVGADQVAHVELTREVARRFNSLYPGDFYTSPDAASWEMPAILEKARKLAGEPKTSTRTNFSHAQMFEAASQTKKLSPFGRLEILPEPQVLLTPSPKLPGLDGRKMSKSYGNTIMLADSEAEIRAKLKVMVTDPARIRRDDPGNPDICPVFDLHKVFSTEAVQQEAAAGCRSASIGCIECKSWVADAIVEKIAPMQERRNDLERRPSVVKDVLANGKDRAIKRASQTLDEVQTAMGLS